MEMSDDKETLYSVQVETPASPDELQDFCNVLEENGYTVFTDLAYGEIEIRDTAPEYDE